MIAPTPRAVIDAPFGHALVALGTRRPDVVALSADLSKYTDLIPFIKAFPKRFFNVGMAEQNLFAMSAGMARTGLLPFCTTYGVFATRRAYDFMAIGCAHSRLPVKIFAGLPGLTTGYGGTHQATEDTGLARLVPDLVVIDPCDATEIAQVVEAVAEYPGPVYVRLLRAGVPAVLDPAGYRFVIGKATVLKQGGDLGFISTGFMTERALDACAELARAGTAAGVLHVPTLKPLDTEAIARFAAGVRHVLVAENHVSSGGLASQVAEVLHGAGVGTPITRIGLPDRFIECGSVPTLQQRYGLTVDRMVAAAQTAY
ncbi:MAG TPA: transketolase C-terminal domain-containing protein [Steroidobacteraceae bacterium]|nr:transketolase C-terminal domain-containing protein [Steroidobacteraceae bacterium]